MERHARNSGQSNKGGRKASGRAKSVDKIFSEQDIRNYVDSSLLEEDFYDITRDVSRYFNKPKRGGNSNAQMFQDPVFYSVYEDDRQKNSAEAAEKSGPQVKEQKKNRQIRNVSDGRKKEKDSGKSKEKHHKRKKLSRHEKRKLGLVISLIITFLLLVGLAIGFIMAYKYSDSKTYVLKRDKTPPTATVTDREIFSYERLDTEDFISDIKDDTEVTVRMINPIDYDREGEQTVSFELVDEAGNKTVLNAKLNIIHDVTPPTVVCEPVIRAVTGQSVAYKSFVVVHDDYDDDPKIKVDNSKVDLSKTGTYPLKYIVTDKSGNKTKKKCQIKVTESKGSVSDEDVMAIVDSTLDWLITDDMDDLHKVWAIYEYIRNIPYVLTDYSYDYKYEGYKLLANNRGDCYGSFAASKLLLDRLGIDNIPIETNGAARHYWNMVSIDNGKHWYHFDATAWSEWGPYRPVMCMISSADLKIISDEHRGTHVYDESQYPKTPKKSMPVPDDIEEIYGYDY